jgi:hypothetical protein
VKLWQQSRSCFFERNSLIKPNFRLVFQLYELERVNKTFQKIIETEQHWFLPLDSKEISGGPPRSSSDEKADITIKVVHENVSNGSSSSSSSGQQQKTNETK